MAIDDAVTLAFDGQQVIVTGKPALPVEIAKPGVDYYLGFLLKGVDEQGGETFYAGFQTAEITEDKGRTYFFPSNISGADKWVLYVGAADGMRRAKVSRSREDAYSGCTIINFELGGEQYQLLAPHSRGKIVSLFHGADRRELEILLTINQAQGQAARAYHEKQGRSGN